MASKPVLSAALYLRQSLDVQEGIERQRIRCEALAAAKGWTVVEEYVDNDTSASKVRGSGTAWSRMLADANAKRFDVVIAVDLDRLLRTVRDLLTLTETGAKVLTVDGEIDLTTADGEFRATMLAGIARFEARRKGERQKRATAHAAQLGRRTGGRRPFGYEADGVTIRPAEADVVAQGFRDLLLGAPLAEIARNWNNAGHFTTQARYSAEHRGEPSPWQHYSVRMVLTNPRYMGKRAHLGEVVADAEWPAIVDSDTWFAANAILTNPARRGRVTTGKRLLSGLALCGVCGGKVHAGSSTRKGVPAYRCSASLGHFARRAAPIEEYLEAVMVARLSKPDATQLLEQQSHVDSAKLTIEAAGVTARLDALAVEFADGSLTASQLRTATERLRERRAAIARELADSGRVDVLGDIVSASDVAEVWAALPTSRKRAVIAALATIRIYPVGRGVRNFDPASVGIEWSS
jgi:DNA invertase Pin-like site-specific DNA recombinase